jgi:hypothetical protein
MKEHLIFHTYILRRELENVKEDFDKDLVRTKGTLAGIGHYLGPCDAYHWAYEWGSVLEVTREGHLLVKTNDDCSIELEQEFERLKALPPGERWSAALELAKERAGAEIAAMTGKDAPGSREEAESALRQFLAEKAHEADEDTILEIANLLVALAKNNCKDYPFSESIDLLNHWRYAQDRHVHRLDTKHEVEVLAFAIVS